VIATPAGPLISPLEDRPVPDPLNTPALSDDLHAAWLLGPADIAAVTADSALLHRLAAGERPSEDSPAGARLAARLRKVEDGGAR
jgi:hypothetical protein